MILNPVFTYWPKQQKKDVFQQVELVDINNLEAETPGRILIFRMLLQVWMCTVPTSDNHQNYQLAARLAAP